MNMNMGGCNMSKVKMVKSVEEYNAAIARSGLGLSLRARIHGPKPLGVGSDQDRSFLRTQRSGDP